MKKLILIILVATCSFQLVLAQDATTVLPTPEVEASECLKTIENFNRNGEIDDKGISNLLGCAIVTGRVSLLMVPYFIRYLSNYLLGLISIVAVLFVVIGGLMYAISGVMQTKEQGKQFIMNALIGLAVAFLSWSIVSILLYALTG